MALSNAVKGARHSPQRITWKKSDGTAYDLTGATITARVLNKKTRQARAADGTFTIITATSGIFDWAYGATDVSEAGKFDVQFIASYSDNKDDKTFIEPWEVEDAI
jgi:hypothetical protein